MSVLCVDVGGISGIDRCGGCRPCVGVGGVSGVVGVGDVRHA